MLPPSYDTKKDKKEIVVALHWAAFTGNVGLVKFTLDHGAPIDSAVNGLVPLQLACINDSNIAVVQYLIDRGANVNIQKWSKKHSVDKAQAVQGATGSTALHVACANGCIKIVGLLLRNHACIDLRDKYGSTPLDIAYVKNEADIVQLLESKAIRNSTESTFKKTHRRSHSDKSCRRPSLPSIVENKSTSIHSIIMTPTSNQSLSNLCEHNHHRRRSSSVHRPSNDELYSSSKNNSMDFSIYKRNSEDTVMSSSCSSFDYYLSDHSQADWYGHGVINTYEDDNYLLSLERRAFNLTSNEHGELERKEYRRSTDRLYNQNVSSSNEEGYEGEVDEDTSSESLPRLSMDEKRNNNNSEVRKSLDLIRPFTKRGMSPRWNQEDDSSDDEDKLQAPQQKAMKFFSRWNWSKK